MEEAGGFLWYKIGKMDERKLFSRRDFLKLVAVAAGTVALEGPLQVLAADQSPTPAIEGEKKKKREGHPLSPEEEKRLYETSLTYRAQTMEDAIGVARRINWKPENNYEWPDNMCGPLAIDMQVRAGVLPPSVNSADFWLLNPKVSTQLLEQTFPRRGYGWFHSEDSIWTFDFSNKPLYPGDFMYTFGRTYEHMLTVTRVDEKGRAFTVTNLGTGKEYSPGLKEFQIVEVMLYDPANPKSGLFYEWGYGKGRNEKGYSGSAGFSLWRRSLEGSAEVKNINEGEFAVQLDDLLGRSKGEWHVNIRDISGPGGKDIYTIDDKAAIHPASTIKVPIGMAFFKWLETKKVTDVTKFLKGGPGNGRSYEQLLRAMLVNSEEGATETLTTILERNLSGGITGVLKEWKIDQTTVIPRRSTSRDIMILLESLYRGKLVGVEGKKRLLSWMAEYTDGDKTRLGVVKNKLKLPSGWKVDFWNKRGSIAADITVVADVAIFEFTDPKGNKKSYVVELFGYPGKGATYENLEKTIEDAASLFANAVYSGVI